MRARSGAPLRTRRGKDTAWEKNFRVRTQVLSRKCATAKTAVNWEVSCLLDTRDGRTAATNVAHCLTSRFERDYTALLTSLSTNASANRGQSMKIVTPCTHLTYGFRALAARPSEMQVSLASKLACQRDFSHFFRELCWAIMPIIEHCLSGWWQRFQKPCRGPQLWAPEVSAAGQGPGVPLLTDPPPGYLQGHRPVPG
jgi:hypothetical protein